MHWTAAQKSMRAHLTTGTVFLCQVPPAWALIFWVWLGVFLENILKFKLWHGTSIFTPWCSAYWAALPFLDMFYTILLLVPSPWFPAKSLYVGSFSIPLYGKLQNDWHWHCDTGAQGVTMPVVYLEHSIFIFRAQISSSNFIGQMETLNLTLSEHSQIALRMLKVSLSQI